MSRSPAWRLDSAEMLTNATQVFDTRYFTAISAADAFHIIPEEDFDAGESTSGIRPTNSALRVAELVQQLSGTSLLFLVLLKVLYRTNSLV